jgi:hypothetical protein
MANYPDNLPDTPPAAPTPAADPAPQSTYDTLKNAGTDMDAKVDQMTGAKPIVRGTTNPDNNLPATAFHTGVRNFGTSSYGKVRNTPI